MRTSHRAKDAAAEKQSYACDTFTGCRVNRSLVARVRSGPDFGNPAGLLFCVLPMSPGSLNDENAERWE
jgi:hypothetical protein